MTSLNAAWEALKRTVLNPAGGDPRLECKPDGYPIDPQSPHYPAQQIINEFYAAIPEPRVARLVKPAQHAAARVILEAPQPDLFLATEAIVLRRIWLERGFARRGSMVAVIWEFRDILQSLALLLYRREPCATAGEGATLIRHVAGIIQETGTRNFERDIRGLLQLAEGLSAKGLHSAELATALQQLNAALSQPGHWEGADRRRYKEKIDTLLSVVAAPAKSEPATKQTRKAPKVDRRDPWVQSIFDFLTGLPHDAGAAWDTLMLHAQTATSSKPSGKWLKEGGRLVERVGKDTFGRQVVDWFAQVRPTVRTTPVQQMPQPPMVEGNAEILKGLVWLCCHYDDEQVTHAVSNLAQACFKKVPTFGPLSAKVGNACLCTLERLPGFEPVAQLSRLRLKVRYAVALRTIDRALHEAAEKLGMSTEELEEVAVPTYGLDETGSLREEFGEFTAEVRITGTDSTALSWLKQDGKEQKSVPALVKESFATEWKELKRTIQDLEKMLPAQRDRMERLLVQEREWEFEIWLERYHHHPLVSGLSRRLVWLFREGETSVPAIWHEGHFVDANDQPINWLGSATRVRLWHPLGTDVATVAAWRDWLERHEVSQPFKQAHREIYILTDAEMQTGTYSNRFAAHIIRQHQFAALARQRGWKFTLVGAFDSHNTPSLYLPGLDLMAEFWVDSVAGGNGETSEMGIYLHLATDQVRFRDARGETRALVDIPARIFSEVMRDVDLFVGVCSVGNDPTWVDRGEAGLHMAYWREVSFGDLSATARTRHEVLERLLPRLKIAAKCSLEERFLVVQGSLRRYKIHLGSSNIRMEPNDRYLCIVPDRSSVGTGSTKDVFLPFEGDGTLSVILSKAFLLAEDEKIKDSTIVCQIRR